MAQTIRTAAERPYRVNIMAFEGHCRHRVDDALILCSQMGFKGVKSVRGDSRSDSLE